MKFNRGFWESSFLSVFLLSLVLALLLAGPVRAQSTSDQPTDPNQTIKENNPNEDQKEPEVDTQPKLDIYGFAQLDMGYQFKQNDPDWFDVVRPTKLPSFADQFGDDGRWFASVRQTRFGVKSYFPTDLG